MQLSFNGESYPGRLLMKLPYVATQPVTLAISFGGHQYQLTLPAGEANAYLPVEGPDNTVGLMPLTQDPNICIGVITVGYVTGADPNPNDTVYPPAPQQG